MQKFNVIYADCPWKYDDARETAEGWTSIGHDINGLDIHTAIEQLVKTP
jgi:hypothetical protein